MSNNTNDLLQEDVLFVEKRSLIGRYLQYPLSFAWSKFAALFQADQVPSQEHGIENAQSEQYESYHQRDQHLYPRFTDRVDPSLYYTIFFPHKRY